MTTIHSTGTRNREKLRRMARSIANNPSLDRMRVLPTASTYREDPLPDRPMTNRGISLPQIPCLSKPITNYLED